MKINQKHILIKGAYFLALLVLITSFQAEKRYKNDLAELNLKGKIQSLTEYCYRAEETFGKIIKAKKERPSFIPGFDSKISFNKKGNKSKVLHFKTDGSIDFKDTLTYDSKDNLIEFAAEYPNKNKIYKINYKYNSKEKTIEENCFDSNGKLTRKNIFVFNNEGNKIESKFYEADGTPLNSSCLFKYDDNRNAIESTYYNPIEKTYTKGTYKYDNLGNLIEEISYFPDGKLQWKTIYIRDEQGNQVEVIGYGHTNKLRAKTIHEYSFDKQNNWIKRIDTYNGEEKYIIEREIEYYE